VKSCIAQTKKRCIDYKHCGDITKAKRLLHYIKLMEAELEEVDKAEIE
jgi:hypothetical protein